MKSKKNNLAKVLLLKGCFEITYSKNLQECDKVLLNLIEEFLIILKFRYLGPRSFTVPKSQEWYMKVLPEYDDTRFKLCLRVSRTHFADILNVIFPYHKQPAKVKYSIEVQLAVALFRFGTEGNAASFQKVGSRFGISEAGMIRTCTDRIIQSLLCVEKHVINWPNSNERRVICQSMINKLPGCIGYIDGCHIPLFFAPAEDHEAYYSRKQQYGIHLQAVCDNQLLFTSFTVGYPASAHDARVFYNSPIGQHPNKFFDNGQWIAGDSAYRLTANMITPFRENATTGTKKQRRSFNRHFSGYRVKIEQSFGILKRIFGSLRGLRIQVNKASGHRRACEWITACLVLYNIIIPKTELIEIEHEENTNDENQNNCHETEIDCTQRDILFNWFLNRQ